MITFKKTQRVGGNPIVLPLGLSFLALMLFSSCKTARRQESDPYQAHSHSGSTTSIKPPLKKLPSDLPSRVRAWQEIVAENLKSNPLSLYGAGDCVAYTQLWLEKMNSENGIKLFYSQSFGMGDLTLRDGNHVKHDITHVFASDRGLCPNSSDCDQEIIIDASYLQFVEHGQCIVDPKLDACKSFNNLGALPKILIGSQSDVSQFYSKLPVKVQLQEILGVQQFHDWMPESAASLIYSYGPNSKLRSNLAIFGN